MLPWVCGVFGKIHHLLRDIQGGGMAGEPIADAQRRAEVEALVADLGVEAKAELIKGMLDAIVEQGIVIQDVHRGLIDFPSIRDGREVFLCYELGDGDDIRFWHELHAGFMGRTPLE